MSSFRCNIRPNDVHCCGVARNLKQILTKYEHKGFIKAPHSCFVRHPTDKAAHIIGDIKSDVYEAASNLSNNVRSQSTFNMDWTSKGSK